ncbi:acyltransferase family protein [Lacibacter sp. H375]|uniref:acyltransferase family protein n=1 Tax=Lacibacter sp. H375 TaxID=3133424 RepID=UPI0030BF7BD9
MHTQKDQSGNERVYALDALRGIMMLLGLVLHAASTYSLKSEWGTWRSKDPDNNFPFLVLVEYIHAFRMPVFFVAAGFFGALLYYKKGPQALLKNRLQRIVLPFIAGVFIIWPLVQAAFTFSMAAFKGVANPYAEAWLSIKSLAFIPFKMTHLWFLYFLAILALLCYLLAMLFRKETAFTISFNKATAYVLKNFRLRLVVVIACYFLMLVFMGTAGIITSLTWIPNFVVLLLYFVFFGLGWMIYKTESLQFLKTNSIAQLTAATLLFIIADFVHWQNTGWEYTVKQLLTAVSGTLFIFGFIAFFLTYFHSYSKRLSYLMEASYWVYIIHLPIIGFIPGLMADSGLPVFLKFVITLTVTSVLCMISYKYFVRGTFIGMFLNGKVHKNTARQSLN